MASYLISTSDCNDEVDHSFSQEVSSINDVHHVVKGYFGVDKIDINIDNAIKLHGSAAILMFKKKCIITKEF